MKTSFLKWAIATAMAVTVGAVAWAAPLEGRPPHDGPDGAPGGGPMGGPEGGPMGAMGMHALMGPMGEELGLSDAQKDQIRTIFREGQPTMKPLMESLMKEQKALMALIGASPVDDEAIKAQTAKIAPIQASISVERAHQFEKVKKVLTAEQLEKLQKIEASRVENRREFIKKRIEQKQEQKEQKAD